MAYKEFDQIRLDALREVCSIATGNAATSLSAMLGKRVDITVPNIMVEQIEKVPDVFGAREKPVTVIYFSVSGQFSGTILMVLPLSGSLKLANILTGQKVHKIDSLDEMAQSALKEMGNIVTGSYIRVLAQGLKVKIAHSIPGYTHDMLGAILDEFLARLSLETDHTVIMESELVVRKEVFRGHLVFLLAPKAVNSIIQALGAMGEG